MTDFLGVCSWHNRGNSGSFGLCNNRGHFNRDRNPLSAVSRFSIPCTGNVSTPRIQDTFPALKERASARSRSSSLSGETPS